MTELVVPGHLFDKIDGKHLHDFMRQNGFVGSGSKDTKLVKLVADINRQGEEQKAVSIQLFENFLLETIKYSTNRIVITVPLLITENSEINSREALLNLLDETLDEFNVNQVRNNNIIDDEFQLLHRGMQCNDDDIINIELAYGRKVKYNQFVGNSRIIEQVDRFEYVWCEVDVSANELRIIVSNNRKNIIVNKVDGTVAKMKLLFTNKIKSAFNLSENLIDEGPTLFKIYRELTAYLEKGYTDLVTPHEAEIQNFTNSLKAQLSITDYQDIGLENRIFKLFERNLIQNDFETFQNDPEAVGKVLTISFKDKTGSSVRATSGGFKYTDEGMEEVDLQNSDVYFDTRESIYDLQTLGSVLVEWNNNGIILEDDDRYEKIKVKYTVYNGFFVTQFIKTNVRREVYEFILPKFGEYREKPL